MATRPLARLAGVELPPASVGARERNRKSWETLRRDVAAAGFEMADLY